MHPAASVLRNKPKSSAMEIRTRETTRHFVISYLIQWEKGKDSFGILDYSAVSFRFPLENASHLILQHEKAEQPDRTPDQIVRINISIYEKQP